MKRCASCIIFLSLFWIADAQAMTFQFGVFEGFPVLEASGPIEIGDADTLKKLAPYAKLLPHSYRLLSLNSEGGLVVEAIKLADTIRELDFHTIVKGGDRCASACSAVVFIAGKVRTVEEGGLLGFHSCFSAVTGQASEFCNKEIARLALTRGVSYGSVHSFMKAVLPGKVLWLDRLAAECWGLTKHIFETHKKNGPIDACPIEIITGKKLLPTLSWRVGIAKAGYYAFVRPISDHEKAAQVTLFCKENNPGKLYFALSLPGQVSQLISNLKYAKINLDGQSYRFTTKALSISIADKKNFVITGKLPKRETIPVLKSRKTVMFELGMKKPFKEIRVVAPLPESKESLLFVANNCFKY
ncbi:MAG: hypothetical protein ACRBBN_05390 [Methyloligellaceae bacterium]